MRTLERQLADVGKRALALEDRRDEVEQLEAPMALYFLSLLQAPEHKLFVDLMSVCSNWKCDDEDFEEHPVLLHQQCPLL